MVGFTEPNHYRPRDGWRLTLAQWVQSPPAPEESWQHQISRYWRWRTLDGVPLRAAWKKLHMAPAAAKAALDPSPDSGLVPPELFSRLLARSRKPDINPDDNVTKVDIPEPDDQELGFDRQDNIYQPRPRWKATLDGWVLHMPPGNAGSFTFDLYHYWVMRTKEGKSLQKAWADLNMSERNAKTSLEPAHDHRGSIPPDLIGRVVARARGHDDPEADVTGILLYPDPAI